LNIFTNLVYIFYNYIFPANIYLISIIIISKPILSSFKLARIRNFTFQAIFVLFCYIGRSISLVFHLLCLFRSWNKKNASHRNANVDKNPKAAATTSLPSRLPPNWTIHPDAARHVMARMIPKNTSNIKTQESLKVSYMCDNLNRIVITENTKDAMTTALKKVKAAPGACIDVSMLHVIAIMQDINSIILHIPLGVFKKGRSAMLSCWSSPCLIKTFSKQMIKLNTRRFGCKLEGFVDGYFLMEIVYLWTHELNKSSS